ncbi:MAG: hypothetical protein AAF628_04985 [Planctomycetota bacterium]
MRHFRAPDGSYFILVSARGAGLVDWVVVTPAGPVVDPPGLPGLTQALAEAALAGTGRDVSRDLTRELEALARLGQLEVAYSQMRAAKATIPAEVEAEVEAVRQATAALSDPLAWQRAVRAAPAMGPNLHHLPHATLLHVRTTPDALPAVGRLLWEQREGGMLRGVSEAYRRVVASLAQQQSSAPLGELRREILALAYPGHPLARAWETPAEAPVPPDDALAAYQRTQHPSQSCHVIVGDLKLKAAVAVLREIFATSEIRLPPPDAPKLPPRSGVARESRLPPGGAVGVAVGYRMPAGTAPEAAEALARWLTPRLRTRLDKVGGDGTVTAPFPNHTADLLLVEAWPLQGSKSSAGRILGAATTALNEAANQGPTQGEFLAAMAATLTEAGRDRVGQAAFAVTLASRCGPNGRGFKRGYEPQPIGLPTLRKLGREVLRPAGRIVVLRGKR